MLRFPRRRAAAEAIPSRRHHTVRLLFCLLVSCLAAGPSLAAVYSPSAQGATFGGFNEGAALQKAIDAANASGGGTVERPIIAAG
jgi:hypothetical protein